MGGARDSAKALLRLRDASDLEEAKVISGDLIAFDCLHVDFQAELLAIQKVVRGLSDAGSLQDAQELSERVIAVYPKCDEVHYELGRVRLALKNEDGALASFQTAV